MPEPTLSFPDRIKARFGERVSVAVRAHGETTVEVAPADWLEVVRILRDEPEFGFEQLIDLCGVDYLGYGDDEWDTSDVSSEGFSRGVEGLGPGRFFDGTRPAGAHEDTYDPHVHERPARLTDGLLADQDIPDGD